MEFILILAIIFIGIAFLGGLTNKNNKGKPLDNYNLALKKPLTSREIKCLDLIEKKFINHKVMAQAPFISFIRIREKNRSKRQSIFNKLSKKRCDYLICNEEYEPICIIELDDSSHNKLKDKERDFLTTIAGLKTIRINKPEDINEYEFVDNQLLKSKNEYSN